MLNLLDLELQPLFVQINDVPNQISHAVQHLLEPVVRNIYFNAVNLVNLDD